MDVLALVIALLLPRATHETITTYAEVIHNVAQDSDVDPLLVVAVIQHETGGKWNPRAVGKTRDYGLMQLHVSKTTNSKYLGNEKALFDLRKNVEVGVASLTYWRKYHGRCKHRHKWWGHYKWGNRVKNDRYANKIERIHRTLKEEQRKMLIVIEGIDASGKNTQTRLLAKNLPNATRMSFPNYESPSGKLILANLKEGVKDPLVHQALMLYNKCATLGTIGNMLTLGISVVLDRYWQSAYAYGAAEGMDKQEMIDIHRCMPQAKANIFLDIPVSLVKERRPNARDKNETDLVKLNAARENYLELWDKMSRESEEYWAVVDGTASIAQVTQEIGVHMHNANVL